MKNATIKMRFDNALDDLLYEVDWSETDGSDVKSILNFHSANGKYKAEFKKFLGEATNLNKFQKKLISEYL